MTEVARAASRLAHARVGVELPAVPVAHVVRSATTRLAHLAASSDTPSVPAKRVPTKPIRWLIFPVGSSGHRDTGRGGGGGRERLVFGRCRRRSTTRLQTLRSVAYDARKTRSEQASQPIQAAVRPHTGVRRQGVRVGGSPGGARITNRVPSTAHQLEELSQIGNHRVRPHVGQAAPRRAATSALRASPANSAVLNPTRWAGQTSFRRSFPTNRAFSGSDPADGGEPLGAPLVKEDVPGFASRCSYDHTHSDGSKPRSSSESDLPVSGSGTPAA